MPEGHSIHRLAKEHTERFAGTVCRIVAPDGRSDDVAATLDRAWLERVDALGKHLLYVFADRPMLHVHLGRFGSFRSHRPPMPPPVGIVRLRLWNEHAWAELRGAIAVDLYEERDRAALAARIGADLLDPLADPRAAFDRIAARSTAIGALLMDQSIISGIGNVYRSELLFRAGLNPFVPGRDIPRRRLRALWNDAKTLLADGVATGRIVTTRPRDRSSSTAKRVGWKDARYVYRRTGLPCRLCGTIIQSAVLANRNVFWCPVHQVRDALPRVLEPNRRHWSQA